MRLIGWVLLAGCACAPAQVAVGTAAGLSFAEGAVTIDGGKAVVLETRWTELPNGAVVRTGPGGRAELMLNACIALHLDENSEARMVSNRFENTRVELVAGAGIARVDGVLRDTRATVIVRGDETPLSKRGLYRADTDPPRVNVLRDPRADALARWSERREIALLRQSGYNPDAERAWERAMWQFRHAEADGRTRPGAVPPQPPQHRLRFCAAGGK